MNIKSITKVIINHDILADLSLKADRSAQFPSLIAHFPDPHKVLVTAPRGKKWISPPHLHRVKHLTT